MLQSMTGLTTDSAHQTHHTQHRTTQNNTVVCFRHLLLTTAAFNDLVAALQTEQQEGALLPSKSALVLYYRAFVSATHANGKDALEICVTTHNEPVIAANSVALVVTIVVRLMIHATKRTYCGECSLASITLYTMQDIAAMN
eukprot:13718-Heterococcus_DN1.PRE.7